MRLRDFDINLLVTLEAIWTTRNVSNAAKTLNLAQSTVSAALNRLRLALGDELFNWSGSEMVPTPLAEQIMPDVTKLLNGVRTVLTKSLGQVETVERRMVIATADYVVALFGAKLLQRAAAEAPQLSFDLVDMRPQFINRAARPAHCAHRAWSARSCMRIHMSASGQPVMMPYRMAWTPTPSSPCVILAIRLSRASPSITK